MRVSDLMERNVVSLERGDNLDLADDVMRLGRIRHMPVLSHERLVGIVSQRDLFRAGISSVLALRHAAEREWLQKIRVEEVMTTDVVTVAPDLPVRDAVELMLKRRVGCLPVVTDGKLAGLLSESDCMRYLARVLAIAEERQLLPELAGLT
jgi:CBS-domain-containing membrane protein